MSSVNECCVAFIGEKLNVETVKDVKIYNFGSILEYKKAQNRINSSIIIVEKRDSSNEYFAFALEGYKFRKPVVTVFILPEEETNNTVKMLLELGVDFVVRKNDVKNLEEIVDIALKRLIYKRNILKYVSFLEEKMKEEIGSLKESKEHLAQQFKATIGAITNALGLKSEYTSGHSKRVARLVVKVGKKMGLSEEDLQLLEYAGLLHDIGKIGVPDHILNKPGKLTPEEYEEIKKHAVYSVFILKDIPGFDKVKDAALHEHERYDGTGYPSGLKGEEIPLFSRIIAVCDSWDSMVFDRVYRKALPKEVAKKELMENSGTQFDPKIVEIFLEMVNSGEI
jgi:putative nucleotidyltransferase with HDIG domain